MARIADAKLVKDFRPIAVLPVIYKLYSRAMYMLTETACSRLVSAQIAFRPTTGGEGGGMEGTSRLQHGW